jgi:ubiquinone/menaquinone biosynthesis C-methylase UbiE
VRAVADRTAEHSNQVRQLFDLKAPTWSAKYAPDGRLTARLIRLGAAITYHIPVDSRILDLGCGTGELARASASAGMRVTACDISPEMLRCAASSDRNGGVEWTRLDPSWRTLPFQTGSFDAVVAASVLEYVDDPCAVLRECARVIRPGGVMLCTVPDPRHPIRWFEWLVDLATRCPLVSTLGSRWQSLEDYMTYLRISKHRQPLRWWRSAGDQAGLRASLSTLDPHSPSPLRLLTYVRAECVGAHS